MASEKPKISIVCTTYNSSSFVARCLQSLAEQTYDPFEIIVSDDGSIDDTVQIVGRFLSRYPHVTSRVLVNPHRGPSATRNAGVIKAKGDWIAFIDSDDVWHPEKLERVSRAIQMHPGVNFFAHPEKHIRKNGTVGLLDYGLRGFDPGRPLPIQLYCQNIFLTSSVTCQRALLLRFGLFDESLMSGQDYELWLRLSPHIKLHYIKESLGYYYERDGNITSGPAWERWKNAVRIALWHRGKVSPSRTIYRIAWLTGYFLRASFSRWF